MLAEFLDGSIILGGVRSPNRDAGAVGRQSRCHAKSDTAVTARNEGDLTAEVELGSGGKRHARTIRAASRCVRAGRKG